MQFSYIKQLLYKTADLINISLSVSLFHCLSDCLFVWFCPFIHVHCVAPVYSLSSFFSTTDLSSWSSLIPEIGGGSLIENAFDKQLSISLPNHCSNLRPHKYIAMYTIHTSIQ